MEAVPHADRSGPEWGGDGELSKRFIELMKRLGDIGHQFRFKIDPAMHHSRTRPVPNFTRLDPSRPEIAILMDAMLRIREVIATRPWSTSQEATTEHWWADVLADPRARIPREAARLLRS
jgi:hypothetical protein